MPAPGRETSTRSSFLDQAGFDARVAAVASAQHAVLSLRQASACGLSPSALRSRVARGALHRIHRGVYALVPRQLLTRNGLYMAAVLACGDGAVLSHRSAAALLELRPYGGAGIDITVPVRSARRHGGIAVHRALSLTEADVTRVHNIPVTTVARTLFDVAAVLPRRPLERAFDQAEILERFDLRAIRDQLARRPHHAGVPVVRAILAEHYLGSTPTWSELEEAFLAVVRGAGLPDPEINAWVDPGDGERALRVDFVWRAHRVAVETDGRRTHRTRQAHERDPRRDQRLSAAGWRPVRTTWRQLTRRPQELERTLRALLARAAPG